ncbi:PAS domain S-box protein [Dehalogenimonas sp. 4OHTPN]|uniref:histidine kinase n=1 Tax=Dehalogenimonas sp. 4OHTPN TaxID=3166643 RepID=A0AAU8G7X5_9CHLR
MNDDISELDYLTERYQAIFNEARDGIVLIESETGRIIDANQEYQRQTGRNLDTLKTLHVWQTRAPEKQEEAATFFTNLKIQGMTSPIETEFQRPDGTICPVEFIGRKIQIGKCFFYLSITRDITERRQIENRLRESEILYKAIFETTGTAMAIDDAARKLKLVNNRFAILSGYEKEELEGKRSWTEFIDTKYIQSMTSLSDQRKSHPEHKDPHTYEFEWIDKFGHKRNILINSDTIVGTQMTVASLLDITDYKQAVIETEKAKNEANALRESERLKTELLSMVSHELRTPLTAIKGLVTSLLRKDISWDRVEVRDFLENIDHETDRLEHLISDLLDMTRLETGSLTLEPDWFHPGEIVASIEKEIESLCRAHVLKKIIEPDLPLLYVDCTRIGQVLVNLIENAAHFSPEGTVIILEIAENEGNIIFKVTDFGCGIPNNARSQIFNRFYRLKCNSNFSNRGTGLGLAICRGIIEAHNGSINFISKEGHGSTFFFQIPTKIQN